MLSISSDIRDLSREPLVVPAIGEEFFFRRVREGQVPISWQERPRGLAASIEVGLARQLGHGVPNLVRHVDRVATTSKTRPASSITPRECSNRLCVAAG